MSQKVGSIELDLLVNYQQLVAGLNQAKASINSFGRDVAALSDSINYSTNSALTRAGRLSVGLVQAAEQANMRLLKATASAIGQTDKALASLERSTSASSNRLIRDAGKTQATLTRITEQGNTRRLQSKIQTDRLELAEAQSHERALLTLRQAAERAVSQANISSARASGKLSKAKEAVYADSALAGVHKSQRVEIEGNQKVAASKLETVQKGRVAQAAAQTEIAAAQAKEKEAVAAILAERNSAHQLLSDNYKNQRTQFLSNAQAEVEAVRNTESAKLAVIKDSLQSKLRLQLIAEKAKRDENSAYVKNINPGKAKDAARQKVTDYYDSIRNDPNFVNFTPANHVTANSIAKSTEAHVLANPDLPNPGARPDAKVKRDFARSADARQYAAQAEILSVRIQEIEKTMQVKLLNAQRLFTAESKALWDMSGKATVAENVKTSETVLALNTKLQADLTAIVAEGQAARTAIKTRAAGLRVETEFAGNQIAAAKASEERAAAKFGGGSGYGSGYGMSRVGNESLALGAGLALPIVAATLAASNFQTEMLKAANNTTIGTARVNELRDSVISVMKAGTNLDPASLFRASMRIENFRKPGQTHADSQDILKTAAMGATATYADVDKTAEALAREMYQFNVPVKDSARLLNSMEYAAAANNLTLEDMVKSAGRATATASGLDIPLNETIAAFALLTKEGLTATQSTTSYRSIVKSLTQPTNQQKEAIKALSHAVGVDLSTAFGVNNVKARGFMGTLDFLSNALGKNKQAILSLLPDQRSSISALLLMTKRENELHAVVTGMNQAWKDNNRVQNNLKLVQATVEYQFGAMKNKLILVAQALSVKLLPEAIKLIETLNGWIDRFNALSPAQQQQIAQTLKLAAMVVLLGGAFFKVGGFIIQVCHTFTQLSGLAISLATKLGLVKVAEEEVILAGAKGFGAGGVLMLALAGLGYELYNLYGYWVSMKKAQDEATDSATNYANTLKGLKAQGERGANIANKSAVQDELADLKTALSLSGNGSDGGGKNGAVNHNGQQSLKDILGGTPQGHSVFEGVFSKKGVNFGELGANFLDNTRNSASLGNDHKYDTSRPEYSTFAGVRKRIAELEASQSLIDTRLKQINVGGAGVRERAAMAAGADGFALSVSRVDPGQIKTIAVETCAEFVSKVFQKAGYKNLGTVLGAKALRDKVLADGGLQHNGSALPGDLIYFGGGNFEKKGRSGHVAYGVGDGTDYQSSKGVTSRQDIAGTLKRGGAGAYVQYISVPGSKFSDSAGGDLPSFFKPGGGPVEPLSMKSRKRGVGGGGGRMSMPSYPDIPEALLQWADKTVTVSRHVSAMIAGVALREVADLKKVQGDALAGDKVRLDYAKERLNDYLSAVAQAETDKTRNTEKNAAILSQLKDNRDRGKGLAKMQGSEMTLAAAATTAGDADGYKRHHGAAAAAAGAIKKLEQERARLKYQMESGARAVIRDTNLMETSSRAALNAQVSVDSLTDSISRRDNAMQVAGDKSVMSEYNGGRGAKREVTQASLQMRLEGAKSLLEVAQKGNNQEQIESLQKRVDFLTDTIARLDDVSSFQKNAMSETRHLRDKSDFETRRGDEAQLYGDNQKNPAYKSDFTAKAAEDARHSAQLEKIKSDENKDTLKNQDELFKHLRQIQTLTEQDYRAYLHQRYADTVEADGKQSKEAIAFEEEAYAADDSWYNKRLTLLKKDYEARRITRADYISGLSSVSKIAGASHPGVQEGIQTDLDSLAHQAKEKAQKIATSMTDITMSVLKHAKTARQAIRDMFKDLADQMIKRAVESLWLSVVQKLQKSKGIGKLLGGNSKEDEAVAAATANIQAMNLYSTVTDSLAAIMEKFAMSADKIAQASAVGAGGSAVNATNSDGGIHAYSSKSTALTGLASAQSILGVASSGLQINGKNSGAVKTLGNVSQLVGVGSDFASGKAAKGALDLGTGLASMGTLGKGAAAAVPWVGVALAVAGIVSSLIPQRAPDYVQKTGATSYGRVNTDVTGQVNTGYSGSDAMRTLLMNHKSQAAYNSASSSPVNFHPGSIQINGIDPSNVHLVADAVADAVGQKMSYRQAIDNAARGRN